MKQHYNTSGHHPAERARHWQDVIRTTYFDLQLAYADAASFEACLSSWQLGDLSLSRLSSSPIAYRRQKPDHTEQEEQFLVSLPRQNPIRFSQMGRDAHCPAGHFILERSHDPYEFSYQRANNLWVLKIPGRLLRRHLRQPERYCALTLDGSQGMGALFASYLNQVGMQLEQGDEPAHPLIGQQLLELFAACAEHNPAVLGTHTSSVRAAHLQRIEQYVRHHLAETTLNPEQIARACRISTRYLHDLFGDTGQTFSQWLREQRLEGARQTLARHPKRSLAQIAYQWGFNDQSHFSRVFKLRYGHTPSEIRHSQRNTLPDML